MDDHSQLSPVAKPNVRLHGMGIMNAMADVKIEWELTHTEREGLEVSLLKLREAQ